MQVQQDPGWRLAIQEEMNSIWKNETWSLEPLPPKKKTITCKWIFKLNPDINDGPSIKKAYLVARGFEQKHGIDFEETFAPVIKWATLCTTIALAAAKRWNIHHMNVRTAFLYGLLKEKMFTRQPPGFRKNGYENLV